MKKTSFLLFLLALFSTAFAQNSKIFRIGMEYGNGFQEAELSDQLNIRQDLNFYDYGYGYNGRRAALEAGYSYVGIKPQVSLLKDRLHIYSGLRLMMLTSSIGSETGGDAIYLRADNPDAIEFYRLSSLTEKNGYLAVPLEVSYDLFKSGIFSKSVFLSGFFKIGADAGMKIYEKSNVRFRAPEMEAYEQEVLGLVDSEINRIYATCYSALGMQLTAAGGLQFSIETVIPTNVRTKNNFRLIMPNVYSGFQFSVQVPLNFIF